MLENVKVILIGGPPGAGKTTLGRAVAAELGFASLSVDDLVATGRVLTTETSHPALHPMRELGHTRYFTESPPEQLVADAVALDDVMWPAVERVINLHRTTKAPVVIDWWLLSPAKVATLDPEGVASIWLHIDAEVLERRERRNMEFWAESADPARMFSNFMYRSLWRNHLVASQARGLGMPVISQTGEQSTGDLVATVVTLTRNTNDGG